MALRRDPDPVSRKTTLSLNRVLMWICPVLAVLGVVLAVADLVTGEPVRSAVYQFLLAALMVVCGFAARGQVRRAELPDERRS